MQVSTVSEQARRCFGDRYRMLKPLAEHKNYQTWLARDLAADANQVVIRWVRTRTASHDQAIIQTLSALKRSETSAILRPMVWGRRDQLFYWVYPFCVGEPLSDRLGGKPLSAIDTITLALGILGGLKELHRLGLVHGSLRPTQIIIHNPVDLRSLTLINPGVPYHLGIDEGAAPPCDILRYIAPESAGTVDAAIGPPADLYSLGTILYECLCGEALFQGKRSGEVLRQHLARSQIFLHRASLDLPPVVGEMIERLLHCRPEARYQTARAIRSDLEDLRRGVNSGTDPLPVVVGRVDRRGSLARPAFVGRSSEMVRLAKSIESARRGDGVVTLEGRSGLGRSRLLREFGMRARRQGYHLFYGECAGAIVQRPFEILGGVVRDVLECSRNDESWGHKLCQRLEGSREVIATVLPGLLPILGPLSQASLGPDAFSETRAVVALARLLECLGSADAPALIILDGGRWADEQTLKALRHWSFRAGQRSQVLNTVLVISFRSEEIDESHSLRSVSFGDPVLRLGPLSPIGVQHMVESMAGPVPQAALGTVTRLSGGNPFMVSAVLHGLVESGALYFGENGWSVDRQALSDARSSRRAGEFLARRLDLVPGPVLSFLSIAALLGKSFDLELATKLSGLSATAVNSAIHEAGERNFLWCAESGECAFVHEQIRLALVNRFSSEEKKSLHLRAAEYLRRRSPDRIFELTYHYGEAAEFDRALEFALAAAEHARAQQAPQIAALNYRVAQRAPGANSKTKEKIAEGLGDVLMQQALYVEAAQSYRQAEMLSDQVLVRARIKTKLGELEFKRGDMDGSAAVLEEGLGLLGVPVPQRTIGLFWGVFWQLAVQIMHTLLPRLFVGRRELCGAVREERIIALLDRLGYPWWFKRGLIPTAWAHLRQLNLAERYAPHAELAQAYSNHGPAATMIPYWQRAIDYSARAVTIRENLGDHWGQGNALLFHAVALYSASRCEDGLDAATRSYRLLERTGDRWELCTAGWQTVCCLYRLGRLRETAQLAEHVYRSTGQNGNAQGACSSLELWAKAAGGRIPADICHAELERDRDDRQAMIHVLQAEGIRLLADRQPAAAHEVFARAVSVIQAVHLRSDYVLSALPWLVTAQRLEATSCPYYSPKRYQRLIKQAHRNVRRALRMSKRYRNNRPHALREAGLIAALRGRSGAARRFLSKSIAIAEKQGAVYERAESLYARGDVGQYFQWDTAQRDTAHAVAELKRIHAQMVLGEPFAANNEAPPTLSLADRFTTILERGREIATALTQGSIFEATRAAALTLLRGDICLILQENLDIVGDYSAVAGPVESPFCSQMIEEAFSQKTTVLASCGTGGRLTWNSKTTSKVDTRSTSELRGAHSVLCTPIIVGDGVPFCMYVAHQTVPDLFGVEERQLAEFVSTIAGAALENARGFAVVEELRKTLEERVEARTAELADAKDQLEDTVSRLKEASRSRDRFFANVSHELRTPLALILGPLDELEDIDLPAHLSAMLASRVQVIRRNAEHLLEQVDGILDFSQQEAERAAISREPVNLGDVIDGVIESLSPLARRKRLDVAHQRGENLVLDADEKLVRRMVVNLVANAIKYIDVGGRIVVRSERLLRNLDQDELLLEVADNGPGIPFDAREIIFERFRRLEVPAGQVIEGSGIGLAMVKEIVEIHGGRIEVDESAGGGATFRVWFPHLGRPQALIERNIGHHAAMQPRACRESNGSALEAGDQTMPGRILLVEDNTDMQNHVAGMLRKKYHVLTASSGEEGVEIAQRELPDAIVCDVMMSGMNGYEFCQYAGQNPTLRRIPVILLTANRGPRATVQGFEAGASDYVTKPFSAAELLARVEAHLRIRTLTASLIRLEKQNTLGLMAAGIAHEVLNPVNVIVNAVPIIETRLEALEPDEKESGERAEALLAAVRLSAERIDKIVKAVLRFSRQSPDGHEVALVRLSDTIDLTLQIIKGRIPANVSIEQDYSWNEEFCCYATLLSQVFTNLLINALDALEPDGGRISIVSSRRDHLLEIRVRDTGSGVPPALRDRIFEAFYTTKDPGSGTGLGLAISAEIMDLHQGTLVLNSPPGGGSEFVLSLPIR